MKRAIVTGAKGFIGQHLCASLEKDGIDVIKVGRHDLLPIVSNIDVIYHLADSAGDRDYVTKKAGSIFFDNILSSLNILDYWKHWAFFARLVTFGSLWAYPASAQRASEATFWDGPMLPGIEHYGINKRVLHTGLKAYKQQYGFKGTMLTLGNVYGPGDTSKRIIPSLIRRMMDNPDRLEVWGNETRDFIFVEDQVRAIRMATNYDGDHLNINSGIQRSLVDVVNTLVDVLQYKGEVVFLPSDRPGDTRQLDVSKCQAIYDWPDHEMHSLREGLEKTVQWMKSTR